LHLCQRLPGNSSDLYPYGATHTDSFHYAHFNSDGHGNLFLGDSHSDLYPDSYGDVIAYRYLNPGILET